MERKEIIDPEERKPNSITNHIFDKAQGIIIDLANFSVPTTSNGILKEGQRGFKSNVIYEQFKGKTYKVTVTEST